MSPEQWSEISKANPIFSSPDFAKETTRWNALHEEAIRRKLSGQTAIDFIAFGMTRGKEGKLPDSPLTP